jgi:hypothetical protein
MHEVKIIFHHNKYPPTVFELSGSFHKTVVFRDMTQLQKYKSTASTMMT